jgi:hypothetical protein
MVILVRNHKQFILWLSRSKASRQAGAAGIIVSNHGAHHLDYVPATILALEEVHQLMIPAYGVSLLS